MSTPTCETRERVASILGHLTDKQVDRAIELYIKLVAINAEHFARGGDIESLKAVAALFANAILMHEEGKAAYS